MEFEFLNKTYQDKLANFILQNHYTIFGGYIYKTLINGDKTDDIDVMVRSKQEMEILKKKLKRKFKCIELQNNYMSDEYFSYDMTGIKMLCPNNKKYYYVDILMHFNYDMHSFYDFRCYMKNGKLLVSNSHGNEKKIINELRNRLYRPWYTMREKDVKYFKNFKSA